MNERKKVRGYEKVRACERPASLQALCPSDESGGAASSLVTTLLVMASWLFDAALDLACRNDGVGISL